MWSRHSRRSVPMTLSAIAFARGDRTVADDDAELEQLAPDSLRAPEPVLARHGQDQVPHLRTEMRTATARAGFPPPEQAPPLPMPADDRLRCYERQMLAPTGAEPASQDPEQLVPEA